MEIGMGIHGEPGLRRSKLLPADQVAEELVERILTDLPFQRGGTVAVLINGLGGTPLEEQYLVCGKVHQLLDEAGICVHRTYVGEYATSLEMAGLSVSLCRLDSELARLLDRPADTPFFHQLEKGGE